MELRVMVVPAGKTKKELYSQKSYVFHWRWPERYHAFIRQMLAKKRRGGGWDGILARADLKHYVEDRTFGSGEEIRFLYPVVSWEEALEIWEKFWNDVADDAQCWKRFEADLHELARNDEEHDAIERYCVKGQSIEKFYAMNGKDWYAE